LSSHTSFDVDGDKHQQKTDFEQVRGLFEENQFVETVLKHIDSKTKLGNELIRRLEKDIR
jgi:hypothetical protein